MNPKHDNQRLSLGPYKKKVLKFWKICLAIFQDAIELLVKVPKLSIPSVQLLATATVLQTDLIAIEREDDSVIFTERTCEQYLHAQTIILDQVCSLSFCRAIKFSIKFDKVKSLSILRGRNQRPQTNL